MAVLTAMRMIREGKLDTVVPNRDRKDEVGQIAGDLEEFRLALEQADILRRDQEKAKAAEAMAISNRAAMAEQFVSRMEQLATNSPVRPMRSPMRRAILLQQLRKPPVRPNPSLRQQKRPRSAWRLLQPVQNSCLPRSAKSMDR